MAGSNSPAYTGPSGRSLRCRTCRLSVAPQEVVAVVGPSGCGKSTLLEIVCGLQAADSGQCQSGPAVLMPQRRLAAALAQRDRQRGARAARRRQAPRGGRAARRSRCSSTSALEGPSRTPACTSSAAACASASRSLRTLLSGKPVLCLDEPFGALDAITRGEMQTWLGAALAEEPRTVLLVTHDVEEACVLADRVCVMSPRPGRIVAELPVALPRPRKATSPQVVALRERALEALR